MILKSVPVLFLAMSAGLEASELNSFPEELDKDESTVSNTDDQTKTNSDEVRFDKALKINSTPQEPSEFRVSWEAPELIRRNVQIFSLEGGTVILKFHVQLNSQELRDLREGVGDPVLSFEMQLDSKGALSAVAVNRQSETNVFRVQSNDGEAQLAHLAGRSRLEGKSRLSTIEAQSTAEESVVFLLDANSPQLQQFNIATLQDLKLWGGLEKVFKGDIELSQSDGRTDLADRGEFLEMLDEDVESSSSAGAQSREDEQALPVVSNPSDKTN